MPSKIIFINGLPGSGKSTLCKRFILDHQEYTRSNRDDLRVVFGEAEDKVKSYQLELISRVSGPVIIDDTNLSIHNMSMILDKFQDVDKYIIFINTDYETCIARDKIRNASVGKAVIASMYSDYHKNRQEIIDSGIFKEMTTIHNNSQTLFNDFILNATN